MGKAAAITVALGDQIVALLREHGQMPTSEIRARLAGPTTTGIAAQHCPSCTCTTAAAPQFTREGWEIQQRVYPILERMQRRGAVEKARYWKSREVFWRLIEAPC